MRCPPRLHRCSTKKIDRKISYLQDIGFFLKKITGDVVKDFFYLKDVKRVGIYGYGKVGMALCHLLQESGMEISFLIDREAEFLSAKYNISINQAIDEVSLKSVDAIMVTPVDSYNLIKNEIMKKYTDILIITIADIIDDFVEKTV